VPGREFGSRSVTTNTDEALSKDGGPRSDTAARVSTYRTVNLVFIGLALYCALLPLISPVLGRVLPGIWGVCVYREITGRPCPLCGLTHAFGALARGDLAGARSRHPLALIFAGLVVGELIFRILLFIRKPDPKHSPAVRADIAIHTVLAAGWAGYLSVTL